MSEGDKYIGLTAGEIEAQRANDRQVGGKHYRTGGDQHWDIVDRFDVPYLEGVASKYPLRWREKGGVEDLEKTLHYIDKILERPDSDSRWSRRPQIPGQVNEIRELIRAHGYTASDVEALFVEQIMCGGNRTAFVFARRELVHDIKRVRDQHGPGTPEDGGQHARQDEETRPLVVQIPAPVFEVHVHMPEGSEGTMSRVGEVMEMKWKPA